MTSQTPPLAGIGAAWYRREDYEQIKLVMEDAHLLPPSFDEWEQKAENGRKQLIAQGHIVIKAYIDPKTFPAWCRGRGLKVNAQARMDFAALEARRITSNIQKS